MSAFQAPSAKTMAERVLKRTDPSSLDRDIKRGSVYVRGYEMPVDADDLREFRVAARRLAVVRRRIVVRAAMERKAISDRLVKDHA